MSAIPAPKIWTPPPRRLVRPRWPNAMFAAGARMLSSAGKVMLDSAGKVILNNGSSICCLYQARLCSDNSLAGVYVKKSQFPSFPSTYYFKTSGGTCMYVQSSDTAPCDSTPLVTGETAVASCEDAGCSPTLCQGKRCGDGVASDVWLPCPPAGETDTYFNSADTVCYTFDNSLPAAGHTATTTLSIVTSCSVEQCVCPACSNPPLPSTVTVGGIMGTIAVSTSIGPPDCGSPTGAFPDNADACQVSCVHTNPAATVWNCQLTANGSSVTDCYNWTQGASNPVLTTASGPPCLLIDQSNAPQLGCLTSLANGGFPTGCSLGIVGWVFEIGVDSNCGGGGTGKAWYIKPGNNPIGTYTLCSQTSLRSCLTFPGTITIS